MRIKFFVYVALFFNTLSFCQTRESDYVSSVALQSDGKIVVGGSAVVDDIKQFTVIRITTAGSVDTTFGTSGFANTLIGSTSEIESIKIQSDGKIVAVGSTTEGGQAKMAIVRYNTNGTLDTSFATTGIVTKLIDEGCAAYDVELQTDGKIVVGGVAVNGSPRFCLVRYNTDGTLDTGFGTSGVVTTAIADRSIGRSVVIQTDGNIVLAGYAITATTGVSQFALARYDTSGVLDSSYGTGGLVTTTIGSQAKAFSAALQADGKIVAVGSSDSDFALARYNTDGTPDTGFGTSGIVVASLNGSDELRSVKIQSDGKIVAGGVSGTYFALGRFNTDGTLDNTFGTGGVVTDAIHTSAGINSIAIQIDGKIVVAGFDVGRAAVARFTTAGVIDTTFANNGILSSPGPIIVLDGEFIFNSFTMTKDAVATPDTKFNDVYSTVAPLFPLRVWSLHASGSTQEPITLAFSIPQDFDSILPVELDIHLVIDNKSAAGTTAAIRTYLDSKANNESFGSAAGGAEQTITSSTFTFTEPTGNNLKHVSLTVPITNSGIYAGDFVFMAFIRVAPISGTEYNADFYLNSVSFRYKKT